VRSVAKARTSVRYDLVVAGGEAFGGQVLHIPVHGTFGTSQTGAGRMPVHGGGGGCRWLVNRTLIADRRNRRP
jgi:hypothetical protein